MRIYVQEKVKVTDIPSPFFYALMKKAHNLLSFKQPSAEIKLILKRKPRASLRSDYSLC